MSNFKNIFRFGWPYLKRYRERLIAGILLGVLFGISNASFVWATKTLFQRLVPEDQKSSAIFLPANIRDFKSFTAKLKEHPDEVSKFIWDQFSATNQLKLSAYKGDDSASVELKEILARELSLIIANPIYDPQRFAGVKLS